MTVAATVPYTAANLKTEIQSGAMASQFTADISASNWPDIANQLNSLTNAYTGPVYHADITGAQLLALCDPGEISSLSSADHTTYDDYINSQDVVISDPKLQAWLTTIFTAQSQPISHAAIIAEATRTGSRAEVVFGAGVQVTGNDVQFAMTGSAPQPHIS